MKNTLEKIFFIVLAGLITLLPIFFLNIFQNPFVTSKMALLILAIIILIIVGTITTIQKKQVSFSLGQFDLSLLLIALSYILSTILRTPNKMEALVFPGTTTIIVSGLIIYFSLNQLDANRKKVIKMLLTLSGILFSLGIVLAYSGITNLFTFLPAYIRNTNFTPDGSYLNSAIFLATVFITAIDFLIGNKKVSRKGLFIIGEIVIFVGLLISVMNILPGKTYALRLPPFKTSWEVAIESIKESPILGIGPGNYLSAFNRYKPLSYNLTNLWNLKYNTASNFYLTIITETGIAGLILVLLLLYQFFKASISRIQKQRNQEDESKNLFNKIALSLLLIAFAFLPAGILPIMLLFILLSLITTTKEIHITLPTIPVQINNDNTTTIQKSNFFYYLPITLISIFSILTVAFISTFAYRFLMAEYYYQKGIIAYQDNDGIKSYNYLTKAASLNNRVDRYHITLAQMNLAIANALSSKDKDSINDADKDNITKLVQQAINESKVAIALNQTRSENWELLGNIYQTIIPVAKGAEEFSVESYKQAITYNPLNANLRISLGSIYYGQKDYDTAIENFKTVTTYIKPNLANAHYNLAFAYKEKGDYDKAIQSMENVLKLVAPNSEDYNLANSNLEDLKQQKELKKGSSQNLNSPTEKPQSSSSNTK